MSRAKRFVDDAGLPVWITWAWIATASILVPTFYVVYRLRVRGRRHLPKRGGVLLVTNHLSSVDPPVAGSVVWPRKLYYMAKIELFEAPFLSFLIPRTGAFPVRRGEADRDAIRTARGLLQRGEAVLMFPEGTRSEDGVLGPAFPGAGMLALVPDVTVVPMALWGTQRRLGPIRAVIGEAIDLSDLEHGPRSERARIATERIMAALADLVPQAGGPRQPPPAPLGASPDGGDSGDAGGGPGSDERQP